MMIANRPCRYGKRAFLALMIGVHAVAADTPDPGWRLVVIPAFERPKLHQSIPGSQTAIIAAARPASLGLFEYATTRGAMRWANDLGTKEGARWLDAAKIDVRRGRYRVIDRILITSPDPMASSLALTPEFYRRFERLLGDGFHVIIPDRTTIALYPRLAGRIPPAEASSLLQRFLIAGHPVSREVFRATQDGLVADGILSEE
jgi:hypothetical protein